MFEALGLDDAAAAVYRAILRSPEAETAAVVEQTELPTAAVRRALNALEERGLVARPYGDERRWSPVAPEVAWDAVVRARQDEADRVRRLVVELQEEFRSARRTQPAELVETVTGRQNVADHYIRLQHTARNEVCVFVKPPFAVPDNLDTESETLDRGIINRAVYDLTVFEYEPKIPIWEFIEAGEEARSHPAVPMKMMIVDRRVALMPLSAAGHGSVETALLVYPSSLLEALIALWEGVWERSTPVGATTVEDLDPTRSDGVLDERLLRIVDLLLVGTKVAGIARQLGTSKTTVERDIARMLHACGAQTRFQAGYRIGRAAAERKLAARVPTR